VAGKPKRQARRAAAGLAPVEHPANGVRPPFEPGNEAALRHGSYADLALSRDDRVAELADRIAATQPVSHPADAGACWRLALVYRRIELSAAALDVADRELARSPLAAYRDGADFLARLREDHRAWLRVAGRIEEELGRTPLSRSKLGLNVAAAQRIAGCDLVQRYGGAA
jgi:hypothetical protein